MKSTIGERIKAERKKQKLSADELALRVGKNRATIYRYENGEIENAPYTVLIPIAEALGVTPSYLLGIEDDEDSNTTKPISNENQSLNKLTNYIQAKEFSVAEINELFNYAKFIVSKRQ